MNCPQCKGTRIEAQQSGLQSMMDVCEYDMACRDCGHGWRGERGLRIYSPDERKEWANVTLVEKKETDGILLPEPAKTWALNTLKEKP